MIFLWCSCDDIVHVQCQMYRRRESWCVQGHSSHTECVTHCMGSGTTKTGVREKINTYIRFIRETKCSQIFKLTKKSKQSVSVVQLICQCR